MTAISLGIGIGGCFHVATGNIAIPDIPLPTAPEAFAGSGWTLEDAGTGGALRLRVVTRPADGGAPITGLQHRIGDGPWTATGPLDAQDRATLAGLQDGTAVTVRLRAVNAIGPGAASAPKTATPSAPVAQPTIAVTQPPALPRIVEGQRPADLAIAPGAATRDPAGSPQPTATRELKRGAGTFASATNWISGAAAAGETVQLRIRWELPGAATVWSDVVATQVEAAVAPVALAVVASADGTATIEGWDGSRPGSVAFDGEPYRGTHALPAFGAARLVHDPARRLAPEAPAGAAVGDTLVARPTLVFHDGDDAAPVRTVAWRGASGPVPGAVSDAFAPDAAGSYLARETFTGPRGTLVVDGLPVTVAAAPVGAAAPTVSGSTVTAEGAAPAAPTPSAPVLSGAVLTVE